MNSPTPSVPAAGADQPVWICAGHRIPLDRPRVMGILNVTPDSFSDGGRWVEPGAAAARGMELVAEGADILDIGGESTRPGAEAVPAGEELRRVEPVIRELARQTRTPLSVDTRHASVARAALAAGACIVNDVSALDDPEMAGVVRAAGAGIVLMHHRGLPVARREPPHGGDVVAEVCAFLEARLAAALTAGIGRGQVVIDPGVGFGKDTAQNLALLGALERIARLAPVLVGASRKRFIGEVTGAPVDGRLAGSLTVALWSLTRGAAIVRVHDVAATRQALEMARALAGE